MTHRFCYLFEILPGKVDEYQLAHDTIPPDVPAAMRAAGIRRYSLFRRGNNVIAVGESERSVPETFASLENDPANAAWSTRIRTLMHDPLDSAGSLLFADEIWRLDGPA